MRVQRHSRSRAPFAILATACVGIGVYGLIASLHTQTLWEQISATVGSRQSTARLVEVGSTTLAVPSWEMFRPQHQWLYVSGQQSLPAGYTPTSLVDVGVPHGDATFTLNVSATIQPSLAALFTHAQADGVPLMVSSAYRSESDQQSLYDTYLAKQGQTYVSQYVAAPLHSEHQTGLAVDITSASPACEKDSFQCSITRPAVEWLATHAPEYGFIQRYPAGKQSITGTAAEEWHYRYVGVPLARALTTSGITFDEFVQQVAPGYARNIR